jgi:hypothetical protein
MIACPAGARVWLADERQGRCAGDPGGASGPSSGRQRLAQPALEAKALQGGVSGRRFPALLVIEAQLGRRGPSPARPRRSPDCGAGRRGRSSGRRARLIDQLELQLEDLEAAVAEDGIAADEAAGAATTVQPFERRRPARPAPSPCRANGWRWRRRPPARAAGRRVW